MDAMRMTIEDEDRAAMEAGTGGPAGNDQAGEDPAAKEPTIADLIGLGDFLASGAWTIRGNSGHGPVATVDDMVDAFTETVETQDVPPSRADDDETFVVGGEIEQALTTAVEAGRVLYAEGDDGDGWYVFSDLTIQTMPWTDGVAMRAYVATHEDCLSATTIDFINMSDDPYFGDELDEEFTVSGSEEEFSEILLAIATTSDAVPADSRCICVASKTEDDEARIAYMQDEHEYEMDTDNVSARDWDLFKICIAHFEPTGHEWQYNDGARDRMSGYYQSYQTMTVEIDLQPTSATLRATWRRSRAARIKKARERLVAWLDSIGCTGEVVERERKALAGSRGTISTTDGEAS